MSRDGRTLVLFRGAGDLATGCIVRLYASGYLVAALEIGQPSSIRRKVSLSECMYDGRAEVEGLRSVRVSSPQELLDRLGSGFVPVLEDPGCASVPIIGPDALVDATVAKRNLGTHLEMAPVVVALGPGFRAGVDVQAVVETNRGHNLGRVILEGRAEPDTGVPGLIGGHGADRVVKAPIAGVVEARKDIGDLVAEGEPLLVVRGEGGEALVRAAFAGVLRGVIRPGREVPAGMKIADIDPRCAPENAFSVSDKARAIGGGVLEALLRFGCRPRG